MPTLHWIGKNAVVNHHQTVPFRLLHPLPEMSAGIEDAGNLLIEGDNLHALKALLPRYAGQVKCIYIDPPYNTGNEGWVYNDAVNAPEMQKWLHHAVGKEAEDLSRHDKWLCMMTPRLQLLRQFLREDGAIFISIDDNEVANLRLLMDEIFDTRNFVASIIWQKRTSPDARTAIGPAHDYIIAYCKNSEKLRLNPIPLSSERAKDYKNPDNDVRGLWASVDLTGQTGHATASQFYTITTPSGRKFAPPEGRCWAMAETTLLRLMSEGRLWFGKDGNARPRLKRYLVEAEGTTSWTWWPNSEVGHNQEATKEVNELLNRPGLFETPKPTRLIKRILQLATDKDSLILDSFAGSGTTGHAVMQLNREDGGNRRFLLVEMEPHIARNVTAERLRRVLCEPDEEKPDKETRRQGDKETNQLFLTEERQGENVAEQAADDAETLSLSPCLPVSLSGFTYCTLGEPLFDAEGRVSAGVGFADLARHVFYTETGQPLPEDADITPPLLGLADTTAVYLLWNGQDAEPLTAARLRQLPPHDGPKIIYAASCRLPRAHLQNKNVAFRQFPYHLVAK